MSNPFVLLVFTALPTDNIAAAASTFENQQLCRAAIPTVSTELKLDPAMNEFKVYCLDINEASALLKKARCIQESTDDGVHIYTCEGIAKQKGATL